jgi:hypothetical protein
MSEHKATLEQWALLEEQSAPEYDNTILELRARVEALEATQHAHVDASRPGKWDHLKIAVETTYGVESKQAEQLMQPRTFTADEVAPIVTSAAPARSLVERVARAINNAPSGRYQNRNSQARAAIREVAAWLREAGDEFPDGVALLLEQEANRG